MSQNTILYHAENHVATLTFNRLNKKNAFTSDMYRAITEAFEQAQNDPDTHVLVMQGDSTLFSAGNDLTDFLHHPPSTPDAPVFQFLNRLATFEKPLIASVCGAAVGVGVTMLLHCDLVFAGDNALFSLPFVNLGLCPEAASSLLLPQRCGILQANAWLLLGEPFNAETALEHGLINAILPPQACNQHAQNIAKKLAKKPMRALIETKQLLKAPYAAQIKETMTQESQLFSQLLTEPAAKQAFASFLKK